MPTTCIVRACVTKYGSSSDVRFHKLPTDPRRRSLWLEAIDRSRADIGGYFGYICSEHFRPEDYETNPEVRRSLGLDVKRLRLKGDVVPTQNLRFGAPQRKLRAVENEVESPYVHVVVDNACRTADGWTQTTNKAATASCQTNGGRNVKTRHTQVNFNARVEDVHSCPNRPRSVVDHMGQRHVRG